MWKNTGDLYVMRELESVSPKIEQKSMVKMNESDVYRCDVVIHSNSPPMFHKTMNKINIID